MFIRNLKFFVMMALALPTALAAMGPEVEKDLVIAYRLPLQKKELLFHTLIRDEIPGKWAPDNYHVTLAKLKVKEKDFTHLGNLLNSVADISLKKLTFTPTKAEKYQVNRPADKAPLVLIPKDAEYEAFKNLNRILHQTLQGYNAQAGKQYSFTPDTTTYVPHVTVVDSNHISNYALDREALLTRLNSGLNGTNLELLQETNSRQLRPGPGTSKHGKRALQKFNKKQKQRHNVTRKRTSLATSRAAHRKPKHVRHTTRQQKRAAYRAYRHRHR